LCLEKNNPRILDKLRTVIKKELTLPDSIDLITLQNTALLAMFESIHKIGYQQTVWGPKLSMGFWESISEAIRNGNYHKIDDIIVAKLKILRYNPEADLLWRLNYNQKLRKHINLPWYELKNKKFPKPNKKYFISFILSDAELKIRDRESKITASFQAIYIALSKRLGKEIDKKYLTNPMTGKPFKIEEDDEFITVTAEDAGPSKREKDFIFKVRK
jgi:hypothetical protein